MGSCFYVVIFDKESDPKVIPCGMTKEEAINKAQELLWEGARDVRVMMVSAYSRGIMEEGSMFISKH